MTTHDEFDDLAELGREIDRLMLRPELAGDVSVRSLVGTADAAVLYLVADPAPMPDELLALVGDAARVAGWKIRTWNQSLFSPWYLLDRVQPTITRQADQAAYPPDEP